MENGMLGIVGVVVGSLLSTVSTLILDRYNRGKRIYINGSKAGFSYPTGAYSEEILSGQLSLYLYNDSSLPKSFMLENIKLSDQDIYFSVIDKSNDKPAKGIVYQVAPNSGIYMEWGLMVHPDIDFAIPDITDKIGVLKYRSGKETRTLSIPFFYFDPA